MKETLIEIEHRRMDRCQTEQIWALAIYAGANAFVVAENGTIARAINPGLLLGALALLGVFVLCFAFQRLNGYYQRRNNLAEHFGSM